MKPKDRANEVLNDTMKALNQANQVKGGGAVKESFVVRNWLEDLPQLNDQLASFFHKHALDDQHLFKFQLACDEMITNIISYAFMDNQQQQLIYIELIKDDLQLTLKITDNGIPFNPLLQQEPDTMLPLEEREVGGLGIHLVKQMMDKVKYERYQQSNVLTLSKNISQGVK